MRRLVLIASVSIALAVPAVSAGAPLPSNCTKEKGTVTCTTGPGKNQGGVGTADETQGNTSNKNPAPQNLECTKKPPKAQGQAIGSC